MTLPDLLSEEQVVNPTHRQSHAVTVLRMSTQAHVLGGTLCPSVPTTFRSLASAQLSNKTNHILRHFLRCPQHRRGPSSQAFIKSPRPSDPVRPTLTWMTVLQPSTVLLRCSRRKQPLPRTDVEGVIVWPSSTGSWDRGCQ